MLIGTGTAGAFLLGFQRRGRTGPSNISERDFKTKRRSQLKPKSAACEDQRVAIRSCYFACLPGQAIVRRNALSSSASTSCRRPWSSASRPPVGRSKVCPVACTST